MPVAERGSRAMHAGIAMVTVAAASWGTWSLFLRPTGLSALVTAPIMFAVMALVAFPLTLREPPARWDRTTLLLLAANTVTDAVNVITFFGALTYTTVAIAVLTHYLAPILIALAAPRIEGTAARGARIAAVCWATDSGELWMCAVLTDGGGGFGANTEVASTANAAGSRPIRTSGGSPSGC